MQPAPMIREVSLDLAFTATLKQIGCVAMPVCRNALIQNRVAPCSSWARLPYSPPCELRRYSNSVQSPMQPAPMICKVSLDLAVAAKQKQVGCVAMRVCRNALIQNRVASYSSWARLPHPPRGTSSIADHCKLACDPAG